MTETALQTSDFGPSLQAALAQGGEVPLFDLVCSIQNDQPHVTAVPRTTDELSETTTALLAALVNGGENLTEALRRGSLRSNIMWTHAHFGETTLFTVAVTGTATEDSTIRTEEILTRVDAYEGIPRVRDRADKIARMCAAALQAWETA
jgi:hypothetical protein